MKLIKAQHIDPIKWNACIARVSKSYFYGLYEYLSAICDWEAIVEEQNGEYLFVIPLPFKKKLALKYLYQPFFCQQLGVFGIDNLSPDQGVEVFTIIKKNYSFGTISWRNEPVSSFIEVEKRPNYILSLNKNFETIVSSFNSNRKRILKRCSKLDTTISIHQDGKAIEQTIDRFHETLGDSFSEIKGQHYTNLKRALVKISENAKIQVFRLSLENRFVASILVVEFSGRLIYLLGYIEDDYRKSGANALLFQEVIKINANTDKILDFEGSKNEGIAKFYESYGAISQLFFELTVQTKMNEILKIVR